MKKKQQPDFVHIDDSEQPRWSICLVRVFICLTKNDFALSYPLSAQQRVWSDWADAQADPSLCLVQIQIAGFVMHKLV